MCERSIAVEDAVFVVKARFPCLGCRIITNSCTCVSLIHFTKLLNKKIEGSLKGLFVVILARFPYNPILYYAHSSLLKENNSANNRLPLGLSVLFYKRRCFYFRICTMFLF